MKNHFRTVQHAHGHLAGIKVFAPVGTKMVTYSILRNETGNW